MAELAKQQEDLLRQLNAMHETNGREIMELVKELGQSNEMEIVKWKNQQKIEHSMKVKQLQAKIKEAKLKLKALQ